MFVAVTDTPASDEPTADLLILVGSISDAVPFWEYTVGAETVETCETWRKGLGGARVVDADMGSGSGLGRGGAAGGTAGEETGKSETRMGVEAGGSRECGTEGGCTLRGVCGELVSDELVSCVDKKRASGGGVTTVLVFGLNSACTGLAGVGDLERGACAVPPGVGGLDTIPPRVDDFDVVPPNVGDRDTASFASGDGRTGAYALSALGVRGGGWRNLLLTGGGGVMLPALPRSLSSEVLSSTVLTLSSEVLSSLGLPLSSEFLVDPAGEGTPGFVSSVGSPANVTLFCEAAAIAIECVRDRDFRESCTLALLGVPVLLPSRYGSRFNAERRRGCCFCAFLSIALPHQIHPPTNTNARNMPPNNPPTIAPIGTFTVPEGAIGAPVGPVIKTVVVVKVAR